MKCSRKMSLKIILKVTKKQSFTLSLEDTIFEKPQRGSNRTLCRFRAKELIFELINKTENDITNDADKEGQNF